MKRLLLSTVRPGASRSTITAPEVRELSPNRHQITNASALAALVEKHYIRAVPVDPFTKSADTWLLVASDDPDHPGVRDLRSGSPDAGSDGSPFVSW